MQPNAYDLVVVGGGVGGVAAALGAARTGARTLLVERGPQVGGTGVHSPVGLICTFCDAEGHPINRGVQQEFFPYLYRPGATNYCNTYDEKELLERYQSLLAAEELLTVRVNTPVTGVRKSNGKITAVLTKDGEIFAKVFIDSHRQWQSLGDAN